MESPVTDSPNKNKNFTDSVSILCTALAEHFEEGSCTTQVGLHTGDAVWVQSMGNGTGCVWGDQQGATYFAARFQAGTN